MLLLFINLRMLHVRRCGTLPERKYSTR